MKKKFINVILSVLVLVVMFTLVGCQKVDKVGQENLFVDRIEEKGVKLSVKRNTHRDVESITVTAIVTPVHATNKNLKWGLKWSNDDDAVLCYDYLNLNVSNDTLSCTVDFVKSFDVPIVLWVESLSNPKIKADCQIDCYERTESIKTFDLEVGLNNDTRTLYSNNNIFDFSIYSYEDLFNSRLELFDLYSEVNKHGTISSITTFEYKISLSEELINTINAYNAGTESIRFTNETINFNSFVNGEYNDDPSLFNLLNLFLDLTQFEILSTAILNNVSSWFKIELICKDYYNDNLIQTKEFVYFLSNFDISNINIESIELDKNNLIF